jgi:hypothetical protein
MAAPAETAATRRGGELGNAARRIGDAAAACGSGERGVGMRGGGGGSGKYNTRPKQMNVDGQLDPRREDLLRPEGVSAASLPPRATGVKRVS